MGFHGPLANKYKDKEDRAAKGSQMSSKQNHLHISIFMALLQSPELSEPQYSHL